MGLSSADEYIGVMSGLLTGTAFTKQFPEIDTTATGHGSSSLQGTVVAIYEIGCFVGSIFCLFAGEKLGRKKCIWLGCIILSIGAALQAGAYGIPQMIVGRIIAGLGNGINTSTIRMFRKQIFCHAKLIVASCLAFGTHESRETRQRTVYRARDQHLWRRFRVLGRLWHELCRE